MGSGFHAARAGLYEGKLPVMLMGFRVTLVLGTWISLLDLTEILVLESVTDQTESHRLSFNEPSTVHIPYTLKFPRVFRCPLELILDFPIRRVESGLDVTDADEAPKVGEFISFDGIACFRIVARIRQRPDSIPATSN
jgi:hypothetical protein